MIADLRRAARSPTRACSRCSCSLEIAYFGVRGTNFLTVGNAFEMARASVEIGLLALALTAVILTGGIDLSVGSLLGLSAVLMGWACARAGPAHGPWPGSSRCGAGLLGGGLNALLVARLGIPPLIVTLGTFSLFRGLAEGWTGGVRNYTNFPEGFLFLGQGRLPGGVPAQLPLFVAGRGLLLAARCTAPAWAAACARSASRRKARVTPGSRWRAGSCSSTSLSGLMAGAGGGRLRGAARPGQGRRGHGLRALRDHRGGARRDLDLRRPRHRARHAARAWPRWPCCRTACAWPTCPRSSPVSSRASCSSPPSA